MMGVIAGCVGLVFWGLARLMGSTFFATVFFQMPERVLGMRAGELAGSPELFGVVVGVVVYSVLVCERWGWISFSLVWAWCLTELMIAVRIFLGVGVVLYLLAMLVLLILARCLGRSRAARCCERSEG